MGKNGLIRRWGLMMLAGLACMALWSVPAAAESGEEKAPDEWTVLFYFCGSDLESRYGFATENLKEMSGVLYPDNYSDILKGNDFPEKGGIYQTGVNVLIETGGCREWHAQELGMDINPGALQRWSFQCYSIHDDRYETEPKFTLMETLPPANMGAPETLADFIRWGVKTCPAKKYALVLWDHGGGALTGICIDELFGGDMLQLYELGDALRDAGVSFETVIMDACLMANLETAWAIRDSAHWMVASEEAVPGKGTAIGRWLQELVIRPECDGEQLGRIICDMTQIKYANENDEQARSILTWSVIDLSKIGRVGEAAVRFIQEMGIVYRDYPALSSTYASIILKSEEYGDGRQKMIDIAGVFYEKSTMHYLDNTLRTEMLNALSDAVVYAIRGYGRSGARGLSFCYPVDCSNEELNDYANNCPSPDYLAYLDAVTDWTAPDWVYEKTERLPEIGTLSAFRTTATRMVSPEGIPCITVRLDSDNIKDIFYRMYRLDEATGQLICLGRTACMDRWNADSFSLYSVANEPWMWPSIDGELCMMDQIMSSYSLSSGTLAYLYNIPIEIGGQECNLRCGRMIQESYDDDAPTQNAKYEVYGVWEGYDENTVLMNRSVKDLSQLAGQYFHMLYPYAEKAKDGKTQYKPGKTRLTMFRSLEVAEIPLPPGTYYIEYEVVDMFRRPLVMERIQMNWDGVTAAFPDIENWTGIRILTE